MVKELKKVKVFADIGTNLGLYTCLAAKVLENGTVYGFEMDKLSFDLLDINCKLNNLTNVNNYLCAVYDEDTVVEFLKTEEPDAGRVIYVKPDKDKEYIKVKTITLDNFFKDKEKPDVLKIDVEGAEIKVLKGMEDLLKRDLVIFLELHGNRLFKFNSDSKEVINFLMDRGYNMYEIIKHRNYYEPFNKKLLRKLSRDTLVDYTTMVYVTKEKI